MIGAHILGIPVEENAPIIIPVFAGIWLWLGIQAHKLKMRISKKHQCGASCQCAH